MGAIRKTFFLKRSLNLSPRTVHVTGGNGVSSHPCLLILLFLFLKVASMSMPIYAHGQIAY